MSNMLRIIFSTTLFNLVLFVIVLTEYLSVLIKPFISENKMAGCLCVSLSLSVISASACLPSNATDFDLLVVEQVNESSLKGIIHPLSA